MITTTCPLSDPEELIAAKDTEWLGAHVACVACFCPRAAVLAHHRGADDRGQDLDYTPPLDYLPNYDTEEIEQTVQQCWGDVQFVLLGLFLVFVLAVVLGTAVDARLWLLFVVACLWGARSLYITFTDIITLHRRLRQAIQADAARPIEEYDEPQPVNWWRLIRSGLTPVEYDDPHEDPQLRGAGRPWRVLHDGSLRIPVFRKWSGKHELSDQHLARIAAYCHLIETAEGGRSPYGIVLFGDDVLGMTVPNIERNQNRFHEGLRTERDVTRTKTSAPHLVATPPTSHCRQCPLGKPRRHRTVSPIADGSSVGDVFRTRAKDGRLYHSPCGDCFRWVPPHAKAAELELF